MGLIAPELDWLAEGLLFSLALGLLLALATGLLMLLRPDTLISLNAAWSRWVDTSGQFGRLDQPRSLERLFYRFHRLAGSLISLGAGFVLWQWMFAYLRSGLFQMLGARWARPELNWIVGAGEWIVVGLHVLILGIGLVILLRPSLLKRVEQEGNRWHDSEVTAALDRVYTPVEQGLLAHPRLSGAILLLASSWCLAWLAPVLIGVFVR